MRKIKPAPQNIGTGTDYRAMMSEQKPNKYKQMYRCADCGL